MDQSVQTAFSTIKDWDLTAPKQYLIEREGFDAARVQAMEIEYKRFLAMTKAFDNELIPISAEVDPLWHAHILFTHDYTDLCVALGGDYLHHIPAVSADDREQLRDSYKQNTLPIYQRNFGEPDNSFWGRNAQICINCCARTGSGGGSKAERRTLAI